MIMDIREFTTLVRQMRDVQKEYFRTRDKRILACSKELERRVDKAIEEADQPTLFGDAEWTDSIVRNRF